MFCFAEAHSRPKKTRRSPPWPQVNKLAGPIVFFFATKGSARCSASGRSILDLNSARPTLRLWGLPPPRTLCQLGHLCMLYMFKQNLITILIYTYRNKVHQNEHDSLIFFGFFSISFFGQPPNPGPPFLFFLLLSQQV